MKTLTKRKLNKILKDHERWFCSNGAKGKRADLRGIDLSQAYIRDWNLIEADLRNTYLRNADLRDADLRKADLRGADLNGADLRNADLRGAKFRLCDLNNADLRDANIRDTDLSGAKINYPIACPEKGSFIGFKKASLSPYYQYMQCIVELEIPADALRSSSTSRKCRCSKAKIISITNLDGTDANTNIAYSIYDPDFIYKVGETVEVPDFDTNRWDECSTGIHFFITRQEAVDY